MSPDPALAAQHPPDGVAILPRISLDPETRGLSDAFVYISSDVDPPPPPSAGKHPIYRMEKGLPHPRVFGVRAGQRIRFRDLDGNSHTFSPTVMNWHMSRQFTPGVGEAYVFSSSSKDQYFFQPLIRDGEEVILKDPVVMEEIRCDVHPWEKGLARIGVMTHPYFSVTHEGRYEIKGLPRGSYTVSVWHEHCGGTRKRIFVEAGGHTHADFVLEAK